MFIAAMLALDLGVFRKKSKAVAMREALGWCGVWFSLALAFNGLIWWWQGSQSRFGVVHRVSRRVLPERGQCFCLRSYFHLLQGASSAPAPGALLGHLGATVMRFVFILAGVGLLERFHWFIYVFGAFLVLTGIKMALPKKEEFEPEKNIVVRLFRRFYPVTTPLRSVDVSLREDNGRRAATPLFLVLLIIETSDVAFALDSIPAVLAITRDAFIVFTSNIFAILGLRSLYFALQGVMGLFRYLAFGLAVILVFIGSKMLLTGIDVHIPHRIFTRYHCERARPFGHRFTGAQDICLL